MTGIDIFIQQHTPIPSWFYAEIKIKVCIAEKHFFSFIAANVNIFFQLSQNNLRIFYFTCRMSTALFHIFAKIRDYEDRRKIQKDT